MRTVSETKMKMDWICNTFACVFFGALTHLFFVFTFLILFALLGSAASFALFFLCSSFWRRLLSYVYVLVCCLCAMYPWLLVFSPSFFWFLPAFSYLCPLDSFYAYLLCLYACLFPFVYCMLFLVIVHFHCSLSYLAFLWALSSRTLAGGLPRSNLLTPWYILT